MENAVSCVTCGGTNFYKESGFFFCNECQTQTQEIQEQLYEGYDEKAAPKSARKAPSSTKSKISRDQVKLTSWECYNYVLKGLCDELVSLGADTSLNIVVKKLWMKYLLQVEVVNLDKPKLQAVNAKFDAEIVYGKKRRRRSRSTSRASSDSTSIDSASTKRELIKRRRALVKAQFNNSLTQATDKSLLNETLTTLQSSDQSSQSSFPLKFNKYAKKELGRKQSEEHVEEHATDFENTMSCHQFSYNEVSKTYSEGPHVLSVNKIYSILYLGLLLTKSRIQLGDMLRFIREGHLSFNNFKHFFPEEMNDNILTQKPTKKSPFLSYTMQRSSYKLAKFLGILHYLQVQNLADMIGRYCETLNLPTAFKEKCLNTLLASLPKMQIRSNMKAFPNYEARAFSIILFQLKLLFGLDDQTEKSFSKNANKQTFDVMKWLQYLDYRKHVITKVHFPTKFLRDKTFKDSHSFVQFILSKNPEYEKLDPTRKYNKTADDCRQLLLKLKDQQDDIEEPLNFIPSLVPDIDYLSFIIHNRKVTATELEVLDVHFESCNVDYKIKTSAAIKNIRTVELSDDMSLTAEKLREGRAFSVVKLINRARTGSLVSLNSTINIQEVNKVVRKSKLKKKKISENPDEVFYKPYECYWINTNFNLGRLSKNKFEKHFASYPSNFQLIVREMSRIIEQNEQDFLKEFAMTEMYLLYVETFGETVNVNYADVKNDKHLKSLVQRAKRNW